MSTIICCNGIVLDDNSLYCPRCGRRTGRLGRIENTNVQIASLDQEIEIVLNNVGVGSLPVRVTKLPDSLELVGDGSNIIPRGGTRVLRLRFKPDYTIQPLITHHAAITLSIGNAERKDWWQVENEAELPIAINITLAQPSEIRTAAKALLFTEDGKIQCLYLSNPGLEAVSGVVEVPGEFEVSESTNFAGNRLISITLHAQSTVPVWVRSTRHVGAADRILTIRSTDKVIEVLLRQTQERVGARWSPDYVVGIDFGTRNTSMYIRNVADGTVIPVTDQERFPSLLFVDPSHISNCQIGTDATEELNNPASSKDSFLVESIKTLVRREHEVYAEKYGQKFTIQFLLNTYFSALYNLIKEKLNAIGVLNLSNVLTVFTVPVLDNDVQFDTYRSRMRDAATFAGFANDDQLVWFISEPHAAALYFAHLLPELAANQIMRDGIGQATKVCVVDVGGGTTDVCIGTLTAQANGRWHFKSDRTMSLSRMTSPAVRTMSEKLYPESIRSRQVIQDSQVGGNVIDMEIAYNSIGNYSTKATPHFISDPWDAFYPQVKSEFLFYKVEKFINGIRKIKEELCSFPTNFIDIRHQIDGKCDFNLRFDTDADPAVLNKTNTLFAYSEDVVPIVASIWHEPGVGNRLRAALAEVRDAYIVVPIGGATLVPEFVAQIADFTTGKVIELPPLERVTAVSQGSVWAFDAKLSQSLPVPLYLSVFSDDLAVQNIEILRSHQPITGMDVVERHFAFAEGEEVTLEVLSNFDTTQLLLARYSFRLMSSGRVLFSVRPIDGGSIRVSLDDLGGHEVPIWEARVR